MRFYPAALALSAVLAVSASVSQGAAPAPDPRALALHRQGTAALAAGNAQSAIDAFEAALAVDPSYLTVYLDLARASRAEGLQGKAIHYYREALERDPDNRLALAGEGEALLEKGAIEKARRNLSQIEALCGAECPEARGLSAMLARQTQTPVLTADAVQPAPSVSQN